MKISHLVTLGFIAALGFASKSVAHVDRVIALINESSTSMCAVYFTTTGAHFADSPELLSANNLSCIKPHEAVTIKYQGHSDCFTFVEIFDNVGESLYLNGFELCTRGYIIITDKDLAMGEDGPVPEVVFEEGGEHLGSLEIINTSEQSLCQVYFESLYSDEEIEVYQVGEDGNCIDPDMIYVLEYDLPMSECEVRLSVETGFLDVLYDQVYNLCERSEVLVSD